MAEQEIQERKKIDLRPTAHLRRLIAEYERQMGPIPRGDFSEYACRWMEVGIAQALEVARVTPAGSQVSPDFLVEARATAGRMGLPPIEARK